MREARQRHAKSLCRLGKRCRVCFVVGRPKPGDLTAKPWGRGFKSEGNFSLLGGYGYRAGVVPAILLYQVFCEAFYGGKGSPRFLSHGIPLRENLGCLLAGCSEEQEAAF